MASLAGALKYAFQNRHETPPYMNYHPSSEALAAIIKTAVAAGVYFTFSFAMKRLTPSNSLLSFMANMTVGALVYHGLCNSVGTQPTDAGVGAWLVVDAHKDRSFTIGGAGLGVAKFLLGMGFLFHQFAFIQSFKTTLSGQIDGFFNLKSVRAFNGVEYSLIRKVRELFDKN
jgi:hypothetical protein